MMLPWRGHRCASLCIVVRRPPLLAVPRRVLYGDFIWMKTEKGHTKSDRIVQTKERQAPYLEVSRALEEKVRSGLYPPGSRLPPQRDLAVQLGINVSTVSPAYKELQARGLIVASKRRGSIVTGGAMPFVPASQIRTATGDAASNAVIDLTVNRPATGEFLAHVAPTLPSSP